MERLPKHVAIIMDGNGRWAKEQGQDRLFGHYQGVVSVRKVVEAATELGIEYLTLYAFSTENWDRPEQEVTGLMTLFVDTLSKEVPDLHKNKIKLHFIGNLDMLPKEAKMALDEASALTVANTESRMAIIRYFMNDVLFICLFFYNYTGYFSINKIAGQKILSCGHSF